MSKFDEILNSSDASDALLGEQIDKIEQKSVITQILTKEYASGGTEYNEVGTITLPDVGSVAIIKASYFSGQPVGMKLVRVADNKVCAEIEDTSNYEKIAFTYVNANQNPSERIFSVQIKTSKSSSVVLKALCKIIP